MAGVNKVILVGNLGKDPEMRFTPDGRGICNFSIATSETWKDKNTGEKREKTEWVRIVVFGKLAEICGEYLAKGKQVYIEGKLQTRSWEQDGQTKYMTEVVVDQRGTIQFLSPRDNNQAGSGPSSYGQQRRQQSYQPQAGNDYNGDTSPF